jgi:hypothetical protein
MVNAHARGEYVRQEDHMFSTRVFVTGLLLGAAAIGVACERSSPSAPAAAVSTASVMNKDAAPAAEPPFNLEAVLHGDGFGLVTFRQQKDPTRNIVDLDVWVRDLAPNTSYNLQRAVDTMLDGSCTGTNWLTLGKGPAPEAIVTDGSGSGRASLWRDLSAVPAGSAFDIYFRVMNAQTSDVVLQSDCYRFVVRD